MSSLVGFLLIISAQVTAQTTEDNNPHVMIAPRNGEVDLCKHTPQRNSQFNLTLEKGKYSSQLCLVYTSGSDIKFDIRDDKARCRYNKSNGTISLTITELDFIHTDIYTCHIQTIIPPPYLSVMKKVYVHVHEDPFQVEFPICGAMSDLVKWILIGIACFLSLCLIVIVYQCIHVKHCKECKARNLEMTQEYNNEYMHMAAVSLARCPVP